MRRVAVLISNTGTGSNLQNLIDNQAAGFNGQVVCVISGKADVYGLVRAHEADIPTQVLDYASYEKFGKPRAQYEEDLARLLQGYTPDLIVLAGWSMELTETFLKYFPWRVLNLHPGLLPDSSGERFRLPDGSMADPMIGLAGATAIQTVLASGSKYAGSSLHVLTEDYHGPVLGRTTVEIEPADTVDSLYSRLKAAEHKMVLETMAELCGTEREREVSHG